MAPSTTAGRPVQAEAREAAMRRPAFVLVNAGPPHSTPIYKDVEEVVERFGLRLAPTRLAERAAFAMQFATESQAQGVGAG